MIPNQWYPIFESARLPARRPAGVRRLSQDLVLWRDRDGRAVAMSDRCPHRAARLSRGAVRDGCIQCPYHGFRFNSEGKCVLMPVAGAGAAIPDGFDTHPLPVREGHGLIWLWYGDPAAAESDLPWFEPAAWENGSLYRTSFEVDVSYLRVMENMGDFFHVPFVHRWSMPGMGTRLTNYDAHLEGQIVKLRATLSPDGPRRWYQYEYPLYAELRLPAMAMVEEARKLHLVFAATPIDRDRTWVALRYTQGYLPRRLGGAVLARLLAWIDINPVFRWGDVPTLKSQMLDDPADISCYHMVPADRASALWFGLRNHALRAAHALAQDGPVRAVSSAR
jgi:phenylpropionate dioxygenase-like ring-hydroxylating dioxygenase large terminal subunit